MQLKKNAKMSNPPLVSIIIPAYNRVNLISATLNSIVEQTYQNWECIVVDDGSTDNTTEVVQNYAQNDSRIIALQRPNERNKGANACRNYGLSVANGDYVIFFDSDDVMAPTCLEKRIQVFAEHQEKDILIFSMGVFKEDLKFETYPLRKVFNNSIDATLEEFILSDTLPWNVCRPIFKSKFIKGKIAFNEKIQRFQDGEFNIRVLYFLKPNYFSIDITDCYYRFDDESVNKHRSLKGTQDIVDCFYEYYRTVFSVFSSEQKKKFRKKLITKYFNYLLFYVKPKVNLNLVFKTVSLFKKELALTKKELLLFYMVLFLNKVYLNLKGYYFVSTKLKEMIRK